MVFSARRVIGVVALSTGLFAGALFGGTTAFAASASRSVAATTAPSSQLFQGQKLVGGQSLVSPGGAVRLVMQGDGNLVLYGPRGALWASNTAGLGSLAVLQSDGNFVVYGPRGAAWASGTRGSDQLDVQGDGNLVIYGPRGPIFATGTSTARPAPAPAPGVLAGGGRLGAGQTVRSASGAFTLLMQGDGNLVLFGPGGALWASNTAGRGSLAVLQSDGNFVVYGPRGAVWASNTAGHPGDVLAVQDDGNVVIYQQRTALFATGRTTYPVGSSKFGCPVNDAGRYGADPNVMADTGGGSQLITIADPNAASVAGTFTAWTVRPGGCWVPMAFAGQPAQPYRVETGYAGIRTITSRVEGDGSTPQGLFGFGPTMYGVSGSSPNPAYGYHHLSCGDWWDEQPGSPGYDSFQAYPCGVRPPFAAGSEALWTETVAYVHFADIITPKPPQNSSGIFLHDDTTSGVTAGCVALPAGELDAVLGWMQPAARPHIAIGTAAAMNSL